MRACVHEIYPDVTTREVWICPILITMETFNSASVSFYAALTCDSRLSTEFNSFTKVDREAVIMKR